MEAIWRCKIKEGWWEERERERERERVSHTICLTQSFGLWSGTYGIYFPFLLLLLLLLLFLCFLFSKQSIECCISQIISALIKWPL